MPFPLAAAMGIGAAAGVLDSIFSKPKKRRKYTINDLISYGYKPYNTEEQIGNINRLTDSNLAKRRANENQKASKYGIEPIIPNYAREGDIYDAQMKAIQDAKNIGMNENNRIANLLFQLNSDVDYQNDSMPSDFQRGLDSAIGGAALGGQFYNTLALPQSDYDQNDNGRRDAFDYDNTQYEQNDYGYLPRIDRRRRISYPRPY